MSNEDMGLEEYLQESDPEILERIEQEDPDYDKAAKNSESIAVYKLLKKEENRRFIRNPHELEGMADEDIDIVVHMGCHSVQTPHIIDATADLLENLKYTTVPLGGFNNCCGIMDFDNGDLETAERVDRNRFDNMAFFEPTYAITECTACHATTEKLSMGYQSPEFELASMIEFLNQRQDELLETIERTDPVVVALHDHYDSKGWMPEEQAVYARELLSALPGVEIVEMDHSYEDPLPCNFLADHEEFDDPNRQIFREADAAGADVLITFWHACNRFLAVDEKDFPVTVRNYATFIAERMGFAYQDKYKAYIHAGLAGDVEWILEDARPVYEANGLTDAEAREIIHQNFSPERTVTGAE